MCKNVFSFAFVVAIFAFVPKQSLADTLEIFPLEDGFIAAGIQADETPHNKFLLVAARSPRPTENVRKIFLLFETSSIDLEKFSQAELILTHAQPGVYINPGDPTDPVTLAMYAMAGGDWNDNDLTWFSAPGHDPNSNCDSGNPSLELLAESLIAPEDFLPGYSVVFNDSRIIEFLRGNPGRVTFIITSTAPYQHAGFAFTDSDATTLPEMKPRLRFR